MSELDDLARAANQSRSYGRTGTGRVYFSDTGVGAAVKFGFWAAAGAFLFSVLVALIWGLVVLVFVMSGIWRASGSEG